MSKQRVIAFGMHEHELGAAQAALSDAVMVDSYVIGAIEEEEIPALEQQGLIVQRMEPSPGLSAAETPAAARRGVAAPGGEWQPAEAASLAEPEPGVPTEWLMELSTPLLEEVRDSIEATGATLREHVPPSAYVVTATPEQATDLINLDPVAEVVHYGPAVTGPVVLSGGRRGAAQPAPPSPAEATWDAWVADAEARDRLVSFCAQHGVEVVGAGGRKVRFVLDPDSDLHMDIQVVPGVLNVMEFVPPRLHNDLARRQLGIDADIGGGGDGGAPAFPYAGAGQTIGVADTGIDEAHPDFQGRVADVVARGRPGDASDPHGHGTHVAGSALGDGAASGGRFRGTAPKAQLFFQSLMDANRRLGGLPLALADLFDEAYAAGVRVHNNSWGSSTGSAYTIVSTEVDDFVAAHRDMLIVISAGNDGTAASPRNAKPGFVDWLSIGSPASGKNALTVGAQRSTRASGGFSTQRYSDVWPSSFPQPPIADALVSGDMHCLAGFSSRGPCDDRRIKPDVVAPGTDIISARASTGDVNEYWGLHENPAYAYMGGTSMAAPLVSGCAALVREFYMTERGITPSAALLKATLINGTTWLGGDDAIADFPKQPNYHQGFGAVDLRSSIPNPRNPDLRLELVDSWQTPQLQIARTGGRFRFAVDAEPDLPLRITLAYTDLPARGLQNDLSLMVQEPDGTKRVGNEDVPNSLNIPDPDNNVEVIKIDSPVAGRYLLQVFARNLLRGPQDFALVVTGALASPLRRAPG